ncbi:MAG: DUF262 domain-containing protein [Sphingobacteriales bacterium]|nr:MAG: DUF262 domain-containing protein [Sphingobacteriales bacterium]
MLNLPTPVFYFDEGEDKKWRVIDGLQRVSTLEHFILGGTEKATIGKHAEPFKLIDLEFRTEFNNKTWAELPRDIQRRISTNQVTINLIGKGTPDQVKYNIFSRINQGGIELEPQEIRTALFQGFRIDFLESLVAPDSVEGSDFQSATNYSVPTKRQQDLDFVTRFISFYLIGHEQYEPDMDTFMTLGTKAIPDNIVRQAEIKYAFNESMLLAIEIFGRDAFRKVRTSDGRRKPINKSLFEVLSVIFAKLNDFERDILKQHKEDFINAFVALHHQHGFSQSITTGTAAKERVKYRYEKIHNLVTNAIW